MILTTSQAADVRIAMRAIQPVSLDFRFNGSDCERIKVVHEQTVSGRVLVWQQLGGVTHNQETYGSRDEFIFAYGL